MAPTATQARTVVPELLDQISPADPRASRSRRDLQRIHVLMRSIPAFKQAIGGLGLITPPRRILELGGGDGSLLLRLARALNPPWRNISLTLLDRHDIVQPETRAGYEALGWQVTVLQADALDWADLPQRPRMDLCLASLFLHHFDDLPLTRVLHAVEMSADAFVALEPRRDFAARVGSRLIGVLGANRVTREDAVKSVAAGFAGREITALWPAGAPRWKVAEYAARPFGHCFAAARRESRESRP